MTGGADRTLRLYNPTRYDPAFSHSSYLHTQTRCASSVPPSALPPALPINTYGNHTHPPNAVAIDVGCTTLLSNSDKTLLVTDVLSGALKRRFRGHAARINAVCHGGEPNGEVYLSGSYDGTVRIWDARSHDPNPIQILKDGKDSISSVLVSSERGEEAQIVVGGVDGCIRTYDLRAGRMLEDVMNEAITGLALTRDRKCLLANRLDSASLVLLEKLTGDVLKVYKGHTAGRFGLECDVSATDDYVLSGSEDGNVVIYDLVKGCQVQVLEGHQKAVCSVAAHPKRDKASVIITVGYDGEAVVWANGKQAMAWDI